MKHTFLFFLWSLCLGVSKAQTDTIPPHIDTAYIAASNRIEILFSEPVDALIAGANQSYLMHEIPGGLLMAILGSGNRLVSLIYTDDLPKRMNLHLYIHGIKDSVGNLMPEDTVALLIYEPAPFDLVIDEIMADPTPAVGLPDVEWIEIRNVSPFKINLMGWRLCRSIGRSGPMPDWQLAPDSVVIVCSSGGVAAMKAFGSSFSVTSFPSLINTGDLLYLSAPDGSVIHTVNYSDEWYQNELKKQGGWTLEMIDVDNPCEGLINWKASRSTLGGSPGRINSEDAVNLDTSPPRLLRATIADSMHVLLWFNESLDSSSAYDINKYTISEGVGHPLSAIVLPPLFDKVMLRLSRPMDTMTVYQVDVNGVCDCLHNEVGMYREAKVGIPISAITNQMVINEVLFNPRPGGVDFVELKNKSNVIVDLKNLYLANRDDAGNVSNIQAITADGYLCFPDDHIVMTTDAYLTRTNYLIPDTAIVIRVNAMPSFNDEEGNVLLLNQAGTIVDELNYYSDWHFKLLEDDEGVSLERIHPFVKTQESTNWHSASAGVGFATPGYKNSQASRGSSSVGAISLSPTVISPDNDGKDDYLTITYQFQDPGNVASIVVFNQNGNAVKKLKQAYLCGTTEKINWDGLDDFGNRLPGSVYIVFTEVFNLKGKKEVFKNAVILK
jgi:hypothetical protein